MKAPIDRLMAKVEIDGADCWLWTGFVRPDGYAKFRLDGRSQYAHRASWELHRGPIPDGLQVVHLCNVRACVNPAHLEPVTQSENLRRDGRAGRKVLKTHCNNGHEFTPANTYVRQDRPGRTCRTCARERGRVSVPMIPPKAHRVRAADLEVLHSLIFLHESDGRATFRAVANDAERPVSAVFAALLRLRTMGLVAWETGRSGTLRPVVHVVAVFE